MQFFRRRKIWLAIIGLACACVATAPIVSPGVLQAAADYWVVSDPLGKRADAIVILGGGYYFRPQAAAELYMQGLAREIWITHASPNPLAPSTTRPETGVEQLTRNLLISHGVSAVAIVDVPGEASSTYEEAELVAKYIATTNGNSLIIPTDPFHTARVKWTYEKLFHDKDVKLTVYPISSATYSTDQWWKSSPGRAAFLNELVKYAYYRIRF